MPELTAVVTQTGEDVVWIKRPRRAQAFPFYVTRPSRDRLLRLQRAVRPWKLVILPVLTDGGRVLSEYRVYR